MSLKFLNLKSFHPGNKKSQKSLYIAEEKQKEDKRKEEERAKEVLAEQEYVKNRQLLSGSRLEAERSKVSFLYTLPPGAAPTLKDDQQQQQPIKKDKDLKDFEKFPILANAPTHGSISSDVKLVHKPLGVLINNVKCLRCGKWGHRSGDRECALIDSNPLEQRNLRMNDPMYNNNSGGSNANNGGNSENTEYKKKFRLNHGAASPKSFGSRNLNNNYSVDDMIENDSKQQQDGEEEDDDQVEREFLASLTKKQRKLLLRQIKLEEKEAKKKKREKRENYSDSSDDDDDERDRKKRKHKSSSSSLKRKSSKYRGNNKYKE